MFRKPDRRLVSALGFFCAILLVGCGPRELTRSKAREILEPHGAQKATIWFTESEFGTGKAMGLWTQDRNNGNVFLTEKGRQYFTRVNFNIYAEGTGVWKGSVDT